MTNSNAVLEMLINATNMLSLQADQQVKAFPTFVVVADELALNFSDAFFHVEQLREENLIDPQQAELLGLIEKDLEDMTDSEDQDLWEVDALFHRNEWEVVRNKARIALAALGREVGEPVLAGLTYVPGKRDTSA